MGVSLQKWPKGSCPDARKTNAMDTYQTEENGVEYDGKPVAGDYFRHLERDMEDFQDRETGFHTLYARLQVVFHQLVYQQVQDKSLKFSGFFPKVDYMLKALGCSKTEAGRVHDMRKRFEQAESLAENELGTFYLHDVKTLALLVSRVFARSPVPEKLWKHFPEQEYPRMRMSREWAGDCLRVSVRTWDDTYLYVVPEQGEERTLKVKYGGGEAEDWAYLKPMLSPGIPLNLIRPRMEEGVLLPEQIVFMPDYLVDVSALAACFENYAVSPLVHLLNKIKPAPDSSAILLGNFASQLLDQEVNFGDMDVPYSKLIRTFFKKNAIALASCPDLDSRFHEKARLQQQNIHKAVYEGLGKQVKGFDFSQVVLEPSFFCEMLGLQGRMDLLQADYRVLLEQKSGKGGFPGTSDPEHPRHQEKHYVQLLLYLAVLHYGFHIGNQDIYAFLLYSRYKQGLLLEGPSPALLHTIFEIRNKLVYCELEYAQEGFRILGNLRPEDFKQRWVGERFWHGYVYPRLVEILEPVQQASALERAYYFRFLTFVENEHVLSKLGDKVRGGTGQASFWRDSLEEKKLAGNIYTGLQISALQGDEAGRVSRILLKFDPLSEENHTDADISNFRPGDIVVLYPYEQGREPDVRATMVHRATIVHLDSNSIEIQLRAAQSNVGVFRKAGNYRWALEHDFMDSSFSSLYKGLHAFLSASQARRDLLLCQRPPGTERGVERVGEYGNEAFNLLVHRAKAAKDFFLVAGPPGTGKTSYGLMNILKETLAADPAASVLLLAYTNRAVDEICGKLQENDPPIGFLRIGGSLTCAPAYSGFLLENRVKECRNVEEIKALIRNTRVFAGTSTALNSQTGLFRLKKFDLAIVDEASQILEPHLIGILSARHGSEEAVRKFVLIGDHKQLPAVVQQGEEESLVREPGLREIGLLDCRHSLFERLWRKYRDDASVAFLLKRQGRMHPGISAFVNRAFYQGLLEEVPLPHQQRDLAPDARGRDGIETLLLRHRLFFVASPKPCKPVSDKVNLVEAEMIAATVKRVYDLWAGRFEPEKTVGVIVPYRNQISAVRQALAAYGIPELCRITIDTVERYQGSQRDVIVYGFTIQEEYQLAFLAGSVFEEDGLRIDRKLNVALTRAKENMVLTGNPALLEKNLVFRNLLEYVKAEGVYFSMDPGTYVRGAF